MFKYDTKQSHLDAGRIGNVWDSHIGSPGNALHHVFMTTQLCLAFLGRYNPHSNSLASEENGRRKGRKSTRNDRRVLRHKVFLPCFSATYLVIRT